MSFDNSIGGFCSKSSGGSLTPRRTPCVPQRANPEVGRIRFMSYTSAATPRWTAFHRKRCALRGDMTRQESERLAATLERHGRKRAEMVLRMPVECASEILSYLPPPRYPEPWVKIDPSGKRQSEVILRCMAANSIFYFMILENDYVKCSERAPRAPIPMKIKKVLERRIRAAQRCRAPPPRRSKTTSPASPERRSLNNTATLNGTLSGTKNSTSRSSHSASPPRGRDDELSATARGHAAIIAVAAEQEEAMAELTHDLVEPIIPIHRNHVPQAQAAAAEPVKTVVPAAVPAAALGTAATAPGATPAAATTVVAEKPKQPIASYVHEPIVHERPMTHMTKPRPLLAPIVLFPPVLQLGPEANLADLHAEHASPSPGISHHSEDGSKDGSTSSIDYQEAEPELDEDDDGGECEYPPAPLLSQRA